MKILKKYFQNWKGLQKLDTKHVPHAQKKIFFKSQNFEYFQKGGVKGGQKIKFLNKYFQIEKGFKNWI